MAKGPRRNVVRKLGVGRWGGGPRAVGVPSRPPLRSSDCRGRCNMGTEKGPMSLFTLHPSMNQTPSSSSRLPQTLDPNGPRASPRWSLQLSGQAGQHHHPPRHSSTPCHCHIIATCRLCDLGKITAPLWVLTPPSMPPSSDL